MISNLESLKKLCEKVTGKTSEATTTAGVVCDIAENYSGGGGGSGVLNTDATGYTSTIEIKEE